MVVLPGKSPVYTEVKDDVELSAASDQTFHLQDGSPPLYVHSSRTSLHHGAGVVCLHASLIYGYEASGKYVVTELLSPDCMKGVAILTWNWLQVENWWMAREVQR